MTYRVVVVSNRADTPDHKVGISTDSRTEGRGMSLQGSVGGILKDTDGVSVCVHLSSPVVGHVDILGMTWAIEPRDEAEHHLSHAEEGVEEFQP